MSTLTKRGKYWYYNRNRYRISLKVTDKATAQQIRAKLDHDYALKRVGVNILSEITLKEMIRDWYRFVNKPPAWYDRINFSIKHFESFSGNLIVSGIDVRMINEFIVDRSKKVAPNTIKNDLNALRQLFDYAVDNLHLGNNPVRRAVIPKYTIQNPRYPIPRETLKLIFAAAIPKDRIYWMICYYTGLAPTDAGTIKKEYVKDNIIFTYRTKTKVAAIIPLNPNLVALGDKIFDCMPLKSARDDSNRRFTTLCKDKFKISHAVVYNLRHSFASHLFDLGLQTNDIKVITGHTSARTTVNYTKVQIKTIRKYIDQL